MFDKQTIKKAWFIFMDKLQPIFGDFFRKNVVDKQRWERGQGFVLRK